jgi:endoglucanase
MKNLIRLLTLIFILLSWILKIQAQETKPTESQEWWNAGRWERPRENPLAKKLPLIQVKGNKLVSSKGDTVLFRGLAISDPDKLDDQGHWNKKHFEKMKEMGAMIVRIPVHPIAWRERTPEKYLALLDQAVEWSTELEMYIIIDWHSMSNTLKAGALAG